MSYLTLEACLGLLREHFPWLRVTDVRAIDEGWDSFVLEVNGQLIFRFPRRPEVEADYQKTRRLLEALAPALSIPVPRQEFHCVLPGRQPGRIVGHRKIPGLPLSRDHLRPPHGPRVATRLGRFLGELHTFPVEAAIQAGVPYFNAALWRQRYRELYLWLRTHAFGMLDASGRASAEALWEGFLSDDARSAFETVLVHGDLACEHILYDPARHEVAGVIDWEDAVVGDPALDFAGLLSGLGRELAEQVAGHYPRTVDAAFWRRAETYSRLAPYHMLQFGLVTGREDFISQGLRDIKGQAHG